MDTLSNIFEILRRSGKTQKDFADGIGVKPQVVSDWKSGRNSSYKTMIPAIAKYFNVSTDEIYGTEKSPADKELDEAKQKLLGLIDRLSDEELEKVLEYADLIELGKHRK